MAVSPDARGRTRRLAEAPAEMRLVHKAARVRDLAQTRGRGEHQGLCSLDPHSYNVSMWELAEAILESTGKIARA